MLPFVPRRDRDRPLPPRRERPLWRGVLYVSAAGACLAAMRPWTRIRFPLLHDVHHDPFGPPAWQSTVGFTCLCTAALVAVMTLGETRTPATQQSVRPASLLLVSLALLSLLFDWQRGPADLRGVSAVWTWAYYAALVCLPTLWTACWMRERLRTRRDLRPGSPPAAPRHDGAA